MYDCFRTIIRPGGSSFPPQSPLSLSLAVHGYARSMMKLKMFERLIFYEDSNRVAVIIALLSSYSGPSL